ncbi:MAG: DUF1566 domain-containing protein [Pseudomonadota bacterium]
MKRKELTRIFLCFALLFFAAVAWAAPVPDTGQTKCYNNTVEIPCPSPGQPFYGQDAQYTINPMSYTKLDGSGNALSDTAKSWVMVKDNVTGLIWEMKTNKDGKPDYNDPHDADNTYTWYDSNPATNGGFAGAPGDGTNTEGFIKALNDAHYGGNSDWRLPTIKELAYIVNYSIYPGPTIDTGYFPNTTPSNYWTSNTYAGNTYHAWGVFFYYGYGSNDYFCSKANSYYVRAVRGGQPGALGNLAIGSFDAADSGSIDDASSAAGSYKDNGNGTVTDTSTGLIWQQTGSSNTQTWEQSLAYCEGLNLAGYTDWRLPTIKELRSLADYSRHNPAINTTYFPNTAASFYWSSTTDESRTGYAWIVNFYYGDDDYDYFGYKSILRDVRAVRGGRSAQPTPPTPGIKANGQDEQITVSSNTPVSVTVSLAPGDQNGKSADWWITYSTPWGWYSLDSNGWTPGINLLAQYPLFGISQVNIFYSALPVGDYAFYFLVDMNPNGILDSPFYYDSVEVHVVN